MRLIKVTVWIAVTMGLVAFFSSKLLSAKKQESVGGSIYDFKMRSLEGEEIDFSQYRGKYMLIVNTASKCGYTPQYAELEKLHEQYGDRLAVLGFPSNNFLWQEPGSNADIAAFCERNYGVKFQMFEKVSVKGRDQHPLFNWLEGESGHAPSWNFCKYLIDREGHVTGFFSSKVTPLDPQIVSKISV